MFKVGDEVVVRDDSRFSRQRAYGKAVVERVCGEETHWDVFVRYGGGIGLFYNLYDITKVVKFKGNKYATAS